VNIEIIADLVDCHRFFINESAKIRLINVHQRPVYAKKLRLKLFCWVNWSIIKINFRSDKKLAIVFKIFYIKICFYASV